MAVAAQGPASPPKTVNFYNEAVRESLRSDLSASLRAAAALSRPNAAISSNVYTKIAESAVQVYSTLSVLATFLAGLQAGLISRTEALLTQSNEITSSKRVLFRTASCIGTSAMLLELIVITLSTLIVLSLTLDKLAAVASQSIHQDNISDTQTHTLLFFQSQIADLKAFKPRKRTNSRDTEKQQRDSSANLLDAIGSSVITQIINKMRGSFWVLGSILLLGTILTIVHVILISWDNIALGITATSLCVPMVALAIRVAYALSGRNALQLDGDTEKAEHTKASHRKLHKHSK